ncbi:hypothetical protein EYF80_006163 [Liparis tanakae]|uniref:Uncharacterized protein n=1 Tax=Liparis tanakae TaxID=230148 RepID=A0A4Z2IZZ0_9TELE|nr:hypothetical protein EYF80_006163 [Liparis tanakae]
MTMTAVVLMTEAKLIITGIERAKSPLMLPPLLNPNTEGRGQGGRERERKRKEEGPQVLGGRGRLPSGFDPLKLGSKFRLKFKFNINTCIYGGIPRSSWERSGMPPDPEVEEKRRFRDREREKKKEKTSGLTQSDVEMNPAPLPGFYSEILRRLTLSNWLAVATHYQRRAGPGQSLMLIWLRHVDAARAVNHYTYFNTWSPHLPLGGRKAENETKSYGLEHSNLFIVIIIIIILFLILLLRSLPRALAALTPRYHRATQRAAGG